MAWSSTLVRFRALLWSMGISAFRFRVENRPVRVNPGRAEQDIGGAYLQAPVFASYALHPRRIQLPIQQCRPRAW